MRQLLACSVLAAALVAAAPAAAQRMSLADRIAVLEQRSADNQAQVDLLNQINQLKAEVQALRSQVEELSHQLKQQQDSGRAQYLDLDGRLNRLEGGDTVDPAISDESAAVPVTPPPRAAVQDRPPTVYGDKGAIAQSADERGAYDTAFSALRAGEYAESTSLFQAFLQQHPDGSYAPNALYWLGESYYVTQNYPMAMTQFQALLDRYPTHDKAPGALLKLGLSQYGMERVDEAEKTLSTVSERYPGSDAARTAADRLSAIQLNRFR
ncbi:tol-pal system protein YbgF [Marilutibacter alkalisoli]|uniref:Cell division coordinator CpoB n=1 Tax=Marilutibacter alkalisoli TaxID=2591633 RepID=A0A514BWT1_9GAMM|nr:tol-pal system protein YbgF [Lysobacter alkalisoli]QDH71863.1 tol-pal system protein YbgF [Lysobacter alkalisoli]